MGRKKTFRKKRKYKHTNNNNNNKRTSKKNYKKTYKKRRLMKGGLTGPFQWAAKTVGNRVFDLVGDDGRQAVKGYLEDEAISKINRVLPQRLAKAARNKLDDPEFRVMAVQTANELGEHAKAATTATYNVLKQLLEQAMEKERSAIQQRKIAIDTEREAERAITTNSVLIDKIELQIQKTKDELDSSKIGFQKQLEIEAQEKQKIEAQEKQKIEAKKQQEQEENEQEEIERKTFINEIQDVLDKQSETLKNIQKRKEQATLKKLEAIKEKLRAEKDLKEAQEEAEKLRKQTGETTPPTPPPPPTAPPTAPPPPSRIRLPPLPPITYNPDSDADRRRTFNGALTKPASFI